jgi:hypothetical protein
MKIINTKYDTFFASVCGLLLLIVVIVSCVQVFGYHEDILPGENSAYFHHIIGLDPHLPSKMDTKEVESAILAIDSTFNTSFLKHTNNDRTNIINLLVQQTLSKTNDKYFEILTYATELAGLDGNYNVIKNDLPSLSIIPLSSYGILLGMFEYNTNVYYTIVYDEQNERVVCFETVIPLAPDKIPSSTLISLQLENKDIKFKHKPNWSHIIMSKGVFVIGDDTIRFKKGTFIYETKIPTQWGKSDVAKLSLNDVLKELGIIQKTSRYEYYNIFWANQHKYALFIGSKVQGGNNKNQPSNSTTSSDAFNNEHIIFHVSDLIELTDESRTDNIDIYRKLVSCPTTMSFYDK